MPRARASVIGDGTPALPADRCPRARVPGEERSRAREASPAALLHAARFRNEKGILYTSCISLSGNHKIRGLSHPPSLCLGQHSSPELRTPQETSLTTSCSAAALLFLKCTCTRATHATLRGSPLDALPFAFLASDVPMEEGNQGILDNKLPAGIQSKLFLVHVHFVSAR